MPPSFGVELAQLQEETRDDLLIAKRVAGRVECDVLPLGPSRGVDERPVLLREAGSRKEKDFRFDSGGVRRRGVIFRREVFCLPEAGRFCFEAIGDDQPLQLRKSRQHLRRVGPVRNRIHAEGDQAFHLTGVHLVEDESPAVVVGLAELGKEVITETVLLRGLLAVVRLQETCDELGRVGPIVHGVRPQGFRRGLLQIGLQVLLIGARQAKVAGEHVPCAHVGGPLDVRVPALRIDAAARHANIAEHELQHRSRVDELHGMAVLRPAEGVKNGPLAIRELKWNKSRRQPFRIRRRNNRRWRLPFPAYTASNAPS